MCEGQEPNSNSLKLDENSTVHRLKAFRVGLAWRMAGSGSFSLLFADLCFLVCARASRSACSLHMVGGGGRLALQAKSMFHHEKDHVFGISS